jgi:hypothetical protein
VAAFVAAFTVLAYAPCENATLEVGYEKVAFFANLDNTPTHGARQLADGIWTSKLGRSEDIEHPLHALDGAVYGHVVQVMKRPRVA